MPGFTVTRGLGPGATPSSLIARGFVKTATTVLKVLRGGKSAAQRAYRYQEENFKIGVMLLKANGKDLSKPIVNTVTKLFEVSNGFIVKAIPRRLVARKSDKIKVQINEVNVKRRK